MQLDHNDAKIGKYLHPRTYKWVKRLPVVYKAQRVARMAPCIFQEWFDNNFILEVKPYLRIIGLSEESKAVLLLDNITSHPKAGDLVNSRIFTAFLLWNTISLIQPLVQGVIQNFNIFFYFKVLYRKDFMCRFCAYHWTLQKFNKTFILKKVTIWHIAGAWQEVIPSTLWKAWQNLCPFWLGQWSIWGISF